MQISKIPSEKIKIGGQSSDALSPVTLLWTGSFVEFSVKASEFRILIEGSYDTFECWIAIEINGEIISRRMVLQDKEWITVFRAKNPDVVTNVKIIKEVQYFMDDKNHKLNIYEIETDGELLEVNNKPLKIEFIGDSITSAEGCAGAKCEEEWISSVFSHTNSYPYMIGKAFDADIRVYSQSGWGIYASWDGDFNAAIPKHYDNWVNKAWNPDVIVINLGTNDVNAFGSSENENIKKACISFLKNLRKHHPLAKIYWAYGMFSNDLEATIIEAMECVKSELNDDRFEYISLPVTSDDDIGSRFHPGRKAHEKIANLLVNRIGK